MVTFPNCKINLGLHVLRKRSDGFHDIETCMYPVSWEDVLEILPTGDKANLQITGQTNLSAGPDNLCLKAYQLLKNEYSLPPVQMHLHKVLPFGAGLGGGSSDAAHTLKTLNQIFELNLPYDKLLKYAALLGSDCPFFIKNKPSFASGKGEILEEINLSLKGIFVQLIFPGFGVSTAEAYAEVFPSDNRQDLREILQQPKEGWKDLLINDFEEGIFKKHPILRDIKKNLYKKGAFFAGMSGSGSSIFGLFKTEPQPVKTSEFKSYSGQLK